MATVSGSRQFKRRSSGPPSEQEGVLAGGYGSKRRRSSRLATHTEMADDDSFTGCVRGATQSGTRHSSRKAPVRVCGLGVGVLYSTGRRVAEWECGLVKGDAEQVVSLRKRFMHNMLIYEINELKDSIAARVHAYGQKMPGKEGYLVCVNACC